MTDHIDLTKYKSLSLSSATPLEISQHYEQSFLDLTLQNPAYLFPENISEFGLSLSAPVRTTTGQRDFIRRTNTNINTPVKLKNLCLDIVKYDPQQRILDNSPLKGLYFKLKDIQNHGWLLAFDIDAKHVAQHGLCSYHNEEKKPDTDLLSLPPFNYPYCFNCLFLTIKYAYDIKNIFAGWGFNAQNINIYFSGQGCHIHVYEPACWHYDVLPRKHIEQLIIEKYKIPIDPVVTCDESRVLRYPGSLNTNVNIPVMKLDEETPIAAFNKVIDYVKRKATSIDILM
jgi:hypothetical protein